MSWSRKRPPRSPLGCLRLPPGCLEEVDPVIVDGELLRRFRLKGTDQILTQAHQRTYPKREMTAAPMEYPQSSLMTTKFEYGWKKEEDPT